MLLRKRIREFREERDLSQADVAKRMGVRKSYVSRVENGHTVPSLETLERFAAALETPLYQLFYDESLSAAGQHKAEGSVDRLESDPEGVIGKRIRKLRQEKGLSQADVGKRMGVLRSYISRVENGHTVPSLETLERLAAALETPLYQLFYDESLSAAGQHKAEGSVDRLESDPEGDREKHFKRIRQFLAKKSRASDDADLVFGTLAKEFSKLWAHRAPR